MKIVGPEKIFYKAFTGDGKLQGIIMASDEKKSISEKEWLKGVSCFVINQNGEVLIEQRVSKGLTPGKLDLCSGHIDNFETPTQSMIRELEEELGIKREISFSKLKAISQKQPAKLCFNSSGQQRNFFIYFFCLKLDQPIINFQKEEVSGIRWVPIEECFELIRRGETKFPSDYDYENIFSKVKEIQQGNKGEIMELK